MLFPKESNENHAASGTEANDGGAEQRGKPKKSVRWRERLEETSGAMRSQFVPFHRGK